MAMRKEGLLRLKNVELNCDGQESGTGLDLGLEDHYLE